MSTNVNLDGTAYTIPAQGESAGWGTTLSSYLIALATSVGNRLRFDASQTLTGGQQTQARTNLGLAAGATAAFGHIAGSITEGNDVRITPSYTAPSGTVTLTSADARVQVMAPSANITVKLPASVYAAGDMFTIKNVSTTYTITLQASDASAITTIFDSCVDIASNSATTVANTAWAIVRRYPNPMAFEAYGQLSGITGPANMKYPSVRNDTHSSYNTSTGAITIKKNGYYNFAFFANTNVAGLVSISGTSATADNDRTIGYLNSTGGGSGNFKLAAGTYYLVLVSGTISATNNGNSFSMSCVGEY